MKTIFKAAALTSNLLEKLNVRVLIFIMLLAFVSSSPNYPTQSGGKLTVTGFKAVGGLSKDVSAEIGKHQSALGTYTMSSGGLVSVGGMAIPPRSVGSAIDRSSGDDKKWDIGGSQSCPRPLAPLNGGDIGGQGNQPPPKPFHGVLSLNFPIGGHRVPQSGSPITFGVSTAYNSGPELMDANSCTHNLKEIKTLNFAS